MFQILNIITFKFFFRRHFHEGRDCNENRAYGIQSTSEYPTLCRNENSE